MGGNRLVTRPSSHLWSATSSTAARAIPDGNLVLYSLPSISSIARHSLPPRPTALCLRPPSAPRSNPPYIAATHTGQILLPRPVATLSGQVASVDYLPQVAVAVTASELAVFDPATKALLSTHTIHHASPLSCVILTSPTHAIVASQVLALVDLSTGTVIRNYSGHKTPTVAAARLPQQRVITAASDKFLSVWDVNHHQSSPSRKRRRKSSSPAHHTLIAPAPVVALTVEDSDPASITIAAVCNTSCVAVWRNYTHSDKPTNPSFVVRTKERTPEPSIFVSAFTKGRVLSILYGNSFNPSLHSLELEVEKDIVLPPVSQNVLAHSAAAEPINDNQAKLDLVERSVALEVPHMNVAPERRKPNGILRDIPSDEDDVLDHGEEEEDVGEEPTLQDKLAALGITNGNNASHPGDPSAGNPILKAPPEPTRIDSRASVLLQAIRSKDAQLFDTCIRITNDRLVVRRTLELVPSSIATTDLLNMLIDRLQRFPRRADHLIVWIREILIWHASALISQEKHPALEAMLSIIDSRTRSFEALMRLEGRLELVVGQAERIQRAGGSNLEYVVPRAEYTEEGQSEEESSDEDQDSVSEDAGSSDDDEEGVESEEEEEVGEEDETGDFSNSAESSSSDENSDEEMLEATENGTMSTDKGSADRHRKMNGSARNDSGDSSSGSEAGSDEGG